MGQYHQDLVLSYPSRGAPENNRTTQRGPYKDPRDQLDEAFMAAAILWTV
jgi:hypothetical protein